MKITASKTSASHAGSTEVKFGDQMSFAAAEAYKLLRTGLLFSFPASEQSCKVIAITSAIRGEGKSTTAINLSYSLAEAGKRVLLIDADMRLPSIAKSLKLPQKPGLSNVLSGQTDGTIPVLKTNLHPQLRVLTGGDTPPNPSELLGSKMMDALLQKVREGYDYIILDLPPVTVVSDALVVTPNCDGALVVVRQEYSTRREVSEALRLLEYCNAKLLGYVLNEADAKGKYYRGGKGKYGLRYYKKYGRSYYGYGTAKKASPAKTTPSEHQASPAKDTEDKGASANV